MKRKHLSLIVVSAVLFAACAERPVTNTTKSSPKPAPSASPTVSVTSTPEDGDYKGKGLVTKIDNNLGSVEIDHEEIKDLMPPMKMEFYVSDKKLLGAVAVGDRVDFVVRYKGGAETVIDLKKEK